MKPCSSGKVPAGSLPCNVNAECVDDSVSSCFLVITTSNEAYLGEVLHSEIGHLVKKPIEVKISGFNLIKYPEHWRNNQLHAS